MEENLINGLISVDSLGNAEPCQHCFSEPVFCGIASVFVRALIGG